MFSWSARKEYVPIPKPEIKTAYKTKDLAISFVINDSGDLVPTGPTKDIFSGIVADKNIKQKALKYIQIFRK